VRRLTLLLATVFVALLLASCRVDTDVVVAVSEDGSGTVTVTVTLDRDAARQLGDPATAVRLDDLRDAGWSVEDPATADDGVVTFRAVRSFAGPDDLAGVLGEIGGGDGSAESDGIFRDVELQVADAFAGTDYSFRTDVELTGSLEQFSDPDLAAALGGLPLARTPEELTVMGADDPATATLALSVSLPGDVTETNSADEATPTWEFPMTGGAATSETASASSSTSQGLPIIVIGIGVVAVLLGLAAAVVALLRSRS
jgi:hypothetical protein